MEIRSFLAFEQPSEIQAILSRVSGELRRSPLDVRWVRPENIHLTVVFLGNIRSEDVETMENPLQKLCLTYGPFQISLKGTGCFPHSRKPRVLWIGLEGDLERMGRFRDSLQEEMQSFGIPKEDRAFSSHITIGRTRSTKNRDKLVQELNNIADISADNLKFNVTKITLFKSTLTPAGPIYDVLKEANLKTT